MLLMEPKQINNNNSKKWIVLVSLFCFEQKKKRPKYENVHQCSSAKYTE